MSVDNPFLDDPICMDEGCPNDSKLVVKQLHAGKFANRKTVWKTDRIWHTDSDGNYWMGNFYHRTPQQLFSECISTMMDLFKNHPELLEKEK